MTPPAMTTGMAGPIIGATAPYQPGDIITYSCAQGYILIGMTESMCGEAPNFEWSLMGNDLPRCIRGKISY